MLPLEDCSKIGTFGDSSNHTSRSEWLPKYLGYEADIFFSKCGKFFVDCGNVIKNWENVFRFWDNGVWTRWGKFSRIMTRIYVIGS